MPEAKAGEMQVPGNVEKHCLKIQTNTQPMQMSVCVHIYTHRHQNPRVSSRTEGWELQVPPIYYATLGVPPYKFQI